MRSLKYFNDIDELSYLELKKVLFSNNVEYYPPSAQKTLRYGAAPVDY